MSNPSRAFDGFKAVILKRIVYEGHKIGANVEEVDGKLIVHSGDNEMVVEFNQGS